MTYALEQAALYYRSLLINLDSITTEQGNICTTVQSKIEAFEEDYEDDLNLMLNWLDTNN